MNLNSGNFDYKNLILFSLPSIFSSLLEPISGVVDTALVGRYDSTLLASLALAVSLISSFVWVFNFLIHTTTQAVASKSSEEDRLISIKVSLISSVLIGVLSSIILILCKDFLYNLIGVQDNLKNLVDDYFYIRVFGHSFSLLFMTGVSILRGEEKVFITFLIVLLTSFFNALFSYISLFHFEMGLAGVSLGSVSAFFLGSLVCLIIIFRKINIKLFLKIRIPKSRIFAFKNDSLNIFGRTIALTSSFFIATKIIGSIGVEFLAAHQILLQFWLFSSFLIDGVALTGTIYCAKLLSENKMSELLNVSKKLLIIGLSIGTFFLSAYLFLSKSLISIFSSDPKVVTIVLFIWPIIFLCQPLNSLAFVLDGLLFGLKAFRSVRIHMWIGFIFIFLPIAFYANMQSSVFLIWLSIGFFNFYRLLSGSFILRRKIIGELDES